MKKFYLFSAGLMLMAAPVFAQSGEAPDLDNRDGKQIFFQGFEADWDTWSTQVVDSVVGISYYKKKGIGDSANGTSYNIYDGSGDWDIFAVKDSTLYLRNGVMLSDAATDSAYTDKEMLKPNRGSSNKFGEDSYKIFEDNDGQRREALSEYGIEPGTHFFRFTSGKYLGSDMQYSNNNVPRYRRNLFVRLDDGDIKPNTSYRLTLYIKAKTVAAVKEITPTFYADVMRGHFHSEKAFSMGIKDDANNYQYKAPFQYTKSDFNGSWEKVTFMTYYLNDSIANQFVMVDGYWWTNDWKWYVNKNTKTGFDFTTTPYEQALEGEELDSLGFTTQPNKFFVRLGFASDSTQFEIDNLSLTQSTIGGVEHYKDMVRVDFGYKTNLKDLAAAAEARTNIASVEVPGKWFTVWGQDSSTLAWKKIEIASAEYHDDGYMYMWTKPEDAGRGRTRAVNFDKYKTVLVSFTNPDVDTLQLKYTGTGKSDAEVFPNALDIDWIKAGKKVFDFNLEESTLNPNIGKGVYSMKNLPPVCQGLPFEDGSFGLPGDTRSLTLKMSRLIEYEENAGQSTKLAILIVSKAGAAAKEYWPVTAADETSATFTRPASYSGVLSGDYEFKFTQLKGESTDMGKDVVVNYSFGPIDRNPEVKVFAETHWAANPNNATQSTPIGTAIRDGKTLTEGYAGGIMIGTGEEKTSRSRFFRIDPTKGLGFDGGMYISGRTSGEKGRFYYGIDDTDYKFSLVAGEYSISFTANGWSNGNLKDVKLYVYKKTTSDCEQIAKIADADKQLIAEFRPEGITNHNDIQIYTAPYGHWDEGTAYSFNFSIAEAGDYILEWVTNASGTTYGIIMSDFKVTNRLGSSATYVTKLNDALAKAKEKIDMADVMIRGMYPYQGKAFKAMTAVYGKYSDWEDTKPSVYEAAIAEINDAASKLQANMDTVDAYNKSYNALIAERDLFNDSLISYSALQDVETINTLVSQNSAFDCSQFDGDAIMEVAGWFDAAVAAIEARMALMAKYDEMLGIVSQMLDDAEDKGSDAWSELNSSYLYYAQLNQMLGSDEAFEGSYNALCTARNNYLYGDEILNAKTRQIKELFALADSLGSDFAGRRDSIEALVNDLTEMDDDLMTILRECVKYEVYRKLAAEEVIDSLDLSALIPNYYFMATGEDMVEKGGNWVFNTNTTAAVPYWNISGIAGSTGKVFQGLNAITDQLSIHPVIAGIRVMDQTQISSFDQTVKGLPNGIYDVMVYIDNYVSNTKMTVSAGNDKHEAMIAKNGQSKAGVYRNAGYEGVKVVDDADMLIKFNLTSASGTKIHFDHMVLTFRGAADGVNYAELLKAEEANFIKTVTFADAPAANAVAVRYYGLDGKQYDAPKAGQVMIRRTVMNNGSSVVEKVIIR